MNITGFIIQRNLFTSTNSYKKTVKIGDISSIKFNKTDAIINVKNHGLYNGSYIYIEDTKSFPSCDGYHEFIDVIDKDNILLKNIKSKTTKSQNSIGGKIFARKKIRFKIIEINKDKNNNIQYKDDGVKGWDAKYFKFNFKVQLDDLKKFFQIFYLLVMKF